MAEWFARPVFHVASVADSLRFYVDRLGFAIAWTYDVGDGTRVAEVGRDTCAVILSDQWPAKVGKALLFISLNAQPSGPDAQASAVDALRTEFESRGVEVQDGHWGYRLLVVEDPDGNQLFFNYPSAAAEPDAVRRRARAERPIDRLP